jgi:hypothetical protein
MDMNQEENKTIERSRIDEILDSEEEIVPSSGFLVGVMQGVREEAAAPAPIPFPWKRALPGFVLVLVVFGWTGVELARLGVAAIRLQRLTMPHLSAAMLAPLEQAGWVALALGLSLASWGLAHRLAGRSGLA